MYLARFHAAVAAAMLAATAPACGDTATPTPDTSPSDSAADTSTSNDSGSDTTADIASDDVPAPDTATEDVATPDTTDVSADDTSTADDASSDVSDAADAPETADEPDIIEPADIAADLTETEDTTPPRPACDPPLTTASPERWARAREFEQVDVTGGSGSYEHKLLTATSGAIINGRTGEYVSGPTTGVVDIIETRDRLCEGRIETHVQVVADMVVLPASVQMQPRASFVPFVSGGSGTWRLRIAAGGTSGAEVVPVGDPQSELKRFRAGADAGEERVEVEDVLTGQVVAITVRVAVDGGPAFDPAHVFLAPGAIWPVTVVGGSGHLLGLTGAPTAPELGIEPSGAGWRWYASTTGVDAVVADTDRFLGTVITQQVTTVDAIGPAAERSGRQAELWTATRVGDINGDELDDIVVGAGEMSVAAPVSGAVFIWAGATDGPDAMPVRRISGAQRNEQFGAAVAAGDFNGDGRPDLAVGGPRFLVGTISVGRAVVYHGVDGAFFAAEPAFGATGARAGDLFGHALAACDFNSDGFDDLAVGAYEAEDVNDPSVATNQGAIYLFQGGPDGLAPVPTQVLFGRVPGGNGFVANADLRLGRALAAGDVDGDGACELVSGSLAVSAENGVAWLYRGSTAPGELVMPLPSAVWRGTRAGRLGWSVAIGDLDRDGLGEVVIGQPRWSTTTTQADNHGALRIARGGSWAATTASDWSEEASFDLTLLNPGTASGDTNDEYGFRLDIGDATGDGHADLVVAGIADEATCVGCVSGTGAVFVLAGLDGALPTSVPVGVATAPTASDRIGAAIAVAGRVRAGGDPVVVVVGGRDDADGADFGKTWVYQPLSPVDATGSVRTPLTMTGLPFGSRVGQGMDLVPDLNGDGHPELIVGAPNGPGPSSTGTRTAAFSGFATLHFGHADGFSTAPDQTLSGFRRHSASDIWAYDVTAMNDFDGDGRPDVAIAARNEDAVTSYGTGTTSTAACNVARSDTGAVAIFGGRADGRLDDQPMLMHFPVQASQLLDAVASLDFNGDGRSDLVVAGRSWDRPGTTTSDNAGGIEIVFGRARASATNTQIVCEPDLRIFGFAASDVMGSALAPLGDLDGDGCDDLAVGVLGGDLLASNAGHVELFFGAGAACATIEVRRLVLASPTSSGNVGGSLDAADVDGDGLAELAIGGTAFRVGGVAMGGAWVVSGRALASVVAQAAPRADNVAPTPVRLFGVNGLAAAEVLGSNPAELFGTGVALVPPHAGSPVASGAMLAVSSQVSIIAGESVGGVVRLYPLRFTGDAVNAPSRAVAVVAGDGASALPTARMEVLPATSTRGRLLWVGASESGMLGPFSGAVYRVPLDAAVEGAW
jgi:hypothetical protein